MKLDISLNKLLNKATKDSHPSSLMKNYVSKDNNLLNIDGVNYDLRKNQIYVLGFGKASAEMGKEIEDIIGIENIVSGLIITTPSKVKTKKIELFESTHPTITKRSFPWNKC